MSSPGSMNPTSVKSLDMHFTKEIDEYQARPVTIRKGGFGTGQGQGEKPEREDVYDYDGRTLTAGSALTRRRRPSLNSHGDDLQEVLEGDEWKSSLDF